MPHSVSLITTLAAAFGLALVLGFFAVRLKLPPLVGYLLAGIVLGPATPGFVADVELARQLAEIGVMLLMFGVGLHLSLDDLLSVRKIAVPGALAQIAVATLLGAGAGVLWGWRPGTSIVFGLALSVASTIVLLRALEDRGVLDSINGRIAVGWLVVEDLAMVLLLVLLPPLARVLGGGPPNSEAGSAASASLPAAIALTLGSVALFVTLMVVVGRRLFPRLLWQVARTGSRELFTLCVIAAAVSVAYGSAKLFGVSYALGAFFAGMMMRESALSHRAATESLPLRDAFSVLFFVSVGMLFDPAMLMREPPRLALVVAIIVFGKSIAAFFIVVGFRYPLNTALTVSASLAQIGEFSFILAGLGVSLGVLPEEARSLVLAGAFVSIALNPLVFHGIEPIQAWIRSRSRLARTLERSDDPLAALPVTPATASLEGHVVVVGYGRVGQRLGDAVTTAGTPIVVAEQNRELVERLRARGIAAVSGDAADHDVLAEARVAWAGMIVIAIPDTFRARKVLAYARTVNPRIATVVRTHSDEEAALLRSDGAGVVFIGEHELADSMTRHVLGTLGRLAPAER